MQVVISLRPASLPRNENRRRIGVTLPTSRLVVARARANAAETAIVAETKTKAVGARTALKISKSTSHDFAGRSYITSGTARSPSPSLGLVSNAKRALAGAQRLPAGERGGIHPEIRDFIVQR